MGHSYRQLSKDAVELLERDEKSRETFLDFLIILTDVVANTIPVEESPAYSEDEQIEMARELCEKLTSNAGLRESAEANRENAFALNRDDEAKQFLNALLHEYNSLRSLGGPVKEVELAERY
jgi:hypothetical protein